VYQLPLRVPALRKCARLLIRNNMAPETSQSFKTCIFLKRIVLFQTQIWRFFDAIFPRKVQYIWRPKGLFSTPEPSVSWSVMSARTLGTRMLLVCGTRTSFQAGRDYLLRWSWPPTFFGTRAEKIAFTRQKSSGPCPVLLVRVPKFRSALPKMNVV